MANLTEKKYMLEFTDAKDLRDSSSWLSEVLYNDHIGQMAVCLKSGANYIYWASRDQYDALNSGGDYNELAGKMERVNNHPLSDDDIEFVAVPYVEHEEFTYGGSFTGSEPSMTNSTDNNFTFYNANEGVDTVVAYDAEVSFVVDGKRRMHLMKGVSSLEDVLEEFETISAMLDIDIAVKEVTFVIE